MSDEISLLGPAQIRQIAVELNLRPTKTLGQNFVIDGNICQKIVRTAQVDENDSVLEIGPGLGSLTLALLQRAREVVAVEIDQRLVNRLPQTAREQGADLKRLHIICADAMDIPDMKFQPTKLVANLPYNVSVPVLLGILEKFPSILSGLVMVQSEVAERLAAKPGNKIYGIPSVKAAWWSDLTLAGKISCSVFWPVPNVDSSLVKFVRHQVLGDENLRKKTFMVVDKAFGQRRKMLRSVLSEFFGSANATEEILLKIGIDPTLRGEALNIAQFLKIAEVLPVTYPSSL